MTKKIEKIFQFMSENRKYNKELQERYYRSFILSCRTEKEKIISLLYHIAATQSRPNIDRLAAFYRILVRDENSLTTFEDFINLINAGASCSFESVYKGMLNQSGWGNKTSALLSKSIYHLHNGQYSEELRIWEDVPAVIEHDDRFYLPVDAVITAVFQKLDPSVKWTFTNINSFLLKTYTCNQIEIWDDLWFWGFITQNGSQQRKFEWNENKYWILKESDKSTKMIEEIKSKCFEFLAVIK
jgi:hypothetical protein